MKARLVAAVLLVLAVPTASAESMKHLSKRVFELARVQYTHLDDQLGPAEFPRSLHPDGSLWKSKQNWWCSGFWPGMLWYTFAGTNDPDMAARADRNTHKLDGLIETPTHHDIGFQLMSSFGKMAQDCDPEFLGGEGISPDSVLTRGAAALASRFLPTAGVIRSWDHGKWNFPVIIDNMMNLELLMDYGDREVAEKHALTTMKNHFREDGTCYHQVNYADDGTVLGKQTVQGFADESAWARGQAWALYGYAMMALKEKEAGHMDLADTFYGVAAKLEDWLLPRLPEDGVPFWDFSQTDYRDASAGAIIAGGLLKLREYRGAKDDGKGLRAAERILRTLASPEYLAEPRTNGGFLLKHSVGHLPNKSEVDVPLTYADYYFLEALTLYPVSAN